MLLICLRVTWLKANKVNLYIAVICINKNMNYSLTIQGAGRCSEVERLLMVPWVVGSILHGVDQLSYFSFQPVLHEWCNKGRGMCYPISVPSASLNKTFPSFFPSYIVLINCLNHWLS